MFRSVTAHNNYTSMLCINLFRTIVILICILTSLALLLASNVGMVGKNTAQTSIFLLELNTKNLDVSQLYSGANGADLSQLGFAEAYIFGMYGYCRGTSVDTSTANTAAAWENINFKAQQCTSSSISYAFDPVSFFVNEINEHNTLGISITSTDITLPGGLSTYVNISKALSHVIVACSIAAICLLALAGLFQLFCWFIGATAIISLLQTLAFISAAISTGAATGAYKYIESQINDNVGDFGIRARLSKNYLVLAWLGTGICLLTLLVMLITRCCCFSRRRPAAPVTYERVL